MNDRQKQVVALFIGIALSIGVIFGIVIGILLGHSDKRTKAKPEAITEYASGFTLEDKEITTLIEDNYWNYIHKAYILIGGEREEATLYKICANVPRHDYNVENFQISDEDGYMHYRSESVEDTLVGIDISTFQGDIDWETLKKSGNIDFVILRVGYRGYGSGAFDSDSKFESNKEAVKEYGIDAGVYFFSQAINYDEGVEEAEYVLNKVKGMNLKYPIIIDTEYVDVEGARGDANSTEERTRAIVGFCETIKNAGYTPMIYASRNWFVQDLDMEQLASYEIWLAQYANAPDFPYKFTGWQYTSTGTVPGIQGEVDINVWFKQN